MSWKRDKADILERLERLEMGLADKALEMGLAGKASVLGRLDVLENYEVDGKRDILSRLDMLELQIRQILERLVEHNSESACNAG